MSWSCCSTARRLLATAALVGATIGAASAQPLRAPAFEIVGAYDHLRLDTVDLAQDTVRLPSPTGALLRSLAVPGWGQIYNRQPLKAPVIWAGLGTLIGISVYSNNRAVLFRRAAIFIDCTADPPQAPPDFCVGAHEFEPYFSRGDALTAGPLTGPAARNLRDQFRRQRDLFILISALAYGLQALDAYVAAELADFDVGEDLLLSVEGTPGLRGITLRWTF